MRYINLIFFKPNRYLFWLAVFFVLSVFSALGHKAIFAAPASPTVAITGDDFLQNGGADDAYDSLIVFDITSSQGNPATWQMEYSVNAGQDWSAFTGNYESISNSRRKYYWSASKIYGPNLLVRIRTQQSGSWTDYFQASLALTHRATNAGAHYHVESFNTADDQGATNNVNWDTNKAVLELSSNNGAHPPPPYHPNGTVSSLDALRNVVNNNVIGVTFQPVQAEFSRLIKYQFSNDGNNWYGDISGNPNPAVWFSINGPLVPDPITAPFNGPAGDKLFWRVNFDSTAQETPQLFQLRLTWQENTSPVACFIVNPTVSEDPQEQYVFNANCSSDFEDNINQLSFRWDFENDGNWDTVFQQGAAGYLKTHIYNSTSTFVALLEARDTDGAVSSFSNSINQLDASGAIKDWLWTSNFGWASLNCDNTYYGEALNLCPPDYGWRLNADYTMSGWAWDNNIGWVCLGDSCDGYGLTPDGDSPVAVYSRNNGQVAGWAKFVAYTGDYSNSGWLKLRGDWCTVAEDQCVHVNTSQRTITGWGWAGGRTDGGATVGPGWVQFMGSIAVPWLETKYGSIYGRGNVGSGNTYVPPQGRYNASYCILAGGSIVNFSSESGCLESAYSDLGFPSSTNKYRTILGVIDFAEIIAGAQVINSQDVDANLPNTADGGAYYFSVEGQDSFTIDAPLTFFNARNLNSSGAGTVVINGDLHINSNMFYESNPVSGKIENLASLAWIVKGDVIVDPGVGNIVGNFIVLGKDGIVCPQAGCGKFRSGNDLGNARQLAVKGLIMAKQIDFERYFKANGEPAEQIIYDGRVMVNTPPGLEDVAKGLPVWREALPTEAIE